MTEMQGTLKRLIQIHRFLREFNKRKTLCETRTDLFELLCRVAVEQGGYCLAWVGIQHGERVIPVAYSGEFRGGAPHLHCGESQHSFSLAEFEEDISNALENLDEYAHRLNMELQLKQLHQAVESSATSVVVSDENGFLQYVNPYFSELTGFDAVDVLGVSYQKFIPHDFNPESLKTMRQQLAKGRQWRGESRVLTREGKSIWVYQQISPISDNQGRTIRFVCTLVDYTELHEAHETIEKMAYFDELTGLPNRRMFSDRLQHEIDRSLRDRQKFSVCYLDLDGFKNVNDTLGHDAGDQLLKAVAQRIRREVRTKDTTSVGIANFPEDGSNIMDLSRHADMAMYHAKARGRNNFQFFTDKLNQEASRRLDIETRLHHAFNHRQFEVRYQPQVDGMDGSLYAVEINLYWPYGDAEGLSQTDLYDHLETSGMLFDVFEWQLTQACQQARLMSRKFNVDFKVAVHLPVLLVRNHDQLFSILNRSLETTGLSYQSIQFEVPESAIDNEYSGSTKVLYELRNCGATVAIDRFGMGGASLHYLSRSKVDVIKIDECLVADVMPGCNDGAVASAITNLAHQLNIKVLACGVETLNHYQYLERYWCDYLQGNFIAPAMSEEQLSVYLAQYQKQGLQSG